MTYIVGNFDVLGDRYIRTGYIIQHNDRFYRVQMGEYYMEYMHIEDHYIDMWLANGRIVELDDEEIEALDNIEIVYAAR